MEINEILEKLNQNLEDLDIIEREISMVELAIYQKNIENLKDDKLNEIREFFNQQSKFYCQKTEKFKKEIDKNIRRYINQIDKLINVYDNLYVNIFRMMENARSNQKNAIANIVTLTENLKKEELSEVERDRLQKNIIACAEKKLNYSVIIDECEARINWCIDNIQKDVNEVFISNTNQVQIYEDNVFSKIRRILFNRLSGKSKYKKFLENYSVEHMKNIESRNNLKIFQVASILCGIIKQIEETKKHITIKYQEGVYNSI